MCQRIFVIVLCVIPIWGFGQSHGLPTGLGSVLARFSCLDDSVDKISVYTGAFGSYTNSAFIGNSKYEAALDFSDYVRIGTFVSIDRRLYRNWTVGFTIPYILSSVYRSTSWYPADTYTQSGITEIKLRLGYNQQSRRIKFYTGVSTDLPLQKGRSAFTSPTISIGNDAFWAFGADAGIIGSLATKLKAFSSLELCLYVPKSGSLVEGGQAMILSSDSVQSIQAQIALRSWASFNVGFVLKSHNVDYSLAYELFAETADNIKQIIPAGFLEQTATLETMKGKPAWNHNLNIGLSTSIEGIRLGIVAKAAVAGHGTFDEKIILLIAGFSF